jgi:hypothetical protein
LTVQRNVTPVSVAGGYWTGSSTIVDLLAEHRDCAVVPEEFTLFSFGQFFSECFEPLTRGIIDNRLFLLNLRRMQDFNRCDMRPFRPIMRRIFGYINRYPAVLFNPRSNMSKVLGRVYEKSCLDLLDYLKVVELNPTSVDISQLMRLINHTLHSAAIGSALSTEHEGVKYGVFDQLVAPPFTEPAQLAVPEMKFINIDRDWRDQYISMRGRYLKMMVRNRSLGLRPFNEDLTIVDDLPMDFFLRLRDRIDRIKNRQIAIRHHNILWLNYEDIVLDTSVTAAKVFDFLNLDPSKWQREKKFYPEKSSERIGKWKKKEWDKEPYRSEISRLAEHLG